MRILQILPTSINITQEILNGLNVSQDREGNKSRLNEIGGLDVFCTKLDVSPAFGLTTEQATAMRSRFGDNHFPEAPMESFCSIFLGSFNDFTLIVLIAASVVSIGINTYAEPDHGFIEGLAILIAVFVVALVTAGNDYSKELQFRDLEKSSEEDERVSVLRNKGQVERINPIEIVVGDILRLQVRNS